MLRSSRQQVIYLASIPFAVAPIAYGLRYSFTHDYDFRFLALAFGAFFGTTAVAVLGRLRMRSRHSLLRLTVLGAAVGAAAAVLAGLLFRGAEWALAPMVLAMAVLFGGCWSISYYLDTISRPGSSTQPKSATPNG